MGASPNLADLLINGRDNLEVTAQVDSYTVRNTQGGFVRVCYAGASLNATPVDAGYENRNLALTEQIEVFGGAAFTFDVQINGGMFDADADGDVDAADLAAFVDCLAGPDVSPSSMCMPQVPLFDGDGDGDVDLADFAAFVSHYTG